MVAAKEVGIDTLSISSIRTRENYFRRENNGTEGFFLNRENVFILLLPGFSRSLTMFVGVIC